MPAFYSTRFKKDIEFPEVEPDRRLMPIESLDVDITEECTLRCSYCFKGTLSLRRKMSMDTAKQLVRWLVRYSRGRHSLSISLLGGEPMLAFDLMRRWVPYVHNYAFQHGKTMAIGITTNLTVFEEEHLEMFRYWHIGIHSSLDGSPCVQDLCRVFPDGTGSSKVVEANLPRILSAWRTTHARSTVVPDTVEHLAESFRYFLDKGFKKVAYALAGNDGWNSEEKLLILREQVAEVLDVYFQRMKVQNTYYLLSLVDRYFRDVLSCVPRQHHCGAGRGLLHVDAEGFLWSCHRFNGLEACEHWVIGHIDGGFHNGRRNAFININPQKHLKPNCETCEAKMYCGCPCVAASWQENGDLFHPGEGHCKALNVLFTTVRDRLDALRCNDSAFYEQLRDWVFNYQW